MPPARRETRKISPRKRIVGPKLSNNCSHHATLPVSGFALTTTFFRWSRRDSACVSAKVGISVLKRVVGFDFPYRSRCVKFPCTVAPFEVIEETWPSDTCLRKNGLYGTRTRSGACVARDAIDVV